MLFLLFSAASAAFSDIAKYERFVPVLQSQTFSSQRDAYPSSLTVQVEWKSQPLELELQVIDLFEEGWSLETYEQGSLVRVVNDTSLFMCHYTGVVKGVPDSEVVMSLCDEIGMRGTIRTPDFHIETQHAVPLEENTKRAFHSEQHIIYDLNDVIVPENRFDHITMNDDREKPLLKVVSTSPDGLRVAYRCAAQTASDDTRMRAYGSANAEAQNTQSLYNQAAARYRNTRWTNGADTVTLAIAGQTQNPGGWTHSATMSTKLSNLAGYKSRTFAARANLLGLTHFNYGSTIGLAYVNTMCQAANSCGVNNVGYSTSDNNRGVLVAHEMGHNFSFDHDSAGNGGNGFVMWPSLLTSAQAFSSYSQTRFRTNVPRYTCLR